MEKKMDRRVRRTRAQLRQALTALLGEKDLKDITVRELTELADVNRGTFYSHYQDVFDMARQVEQELFEDFNRVLDAHPPDQLRRDLYPVLRDAFVQDNSALCMVMIQRQTQGEFARRLSQLIHERCLGEWQGIYPLGGAPEMNYCLEFVVSGTVGLVQAWLKGGLVQTPEEMAALAGRLIVSGLQPIAVQGEEPGGSGKKR